MSTLIILIFTVFLISFSKRKTNIPDSFQLIETKELKKLGATSYTYKHKKTKAKVIYLDDNSPEKVFGIAFKTPVVDDSGVNHVFEHAVLQGSKKYPDKNLFYELDTKNIPSFLNAMTGQDYTVYPFSAVEPKSFDNLMDVYLDAVFNPLVLEDENTLKREGWRYDRNPNNGNLIINGIVYNEMKGAFSNPYRNLSFTLNRIMYPDAKANYRFASGGLPKAIPNLTLDHLRKTHEKYYTPTNSVVVLAGTLDICDKLEKLDEYFKEYDETEKAVIEIQNTPLEDKLHKESYPALSASPNIYVYGMLTEHKTPLPQLMFITSLLADYEISPLKKLFIEEKFSGNFGFYNDGTIQPRGYFLIQGAVESEITKFRKLMDEKLKEITKTGISKEIIDLALRDYKKQLAKSQYSKERASDLTTSIATGEFYYETPYLFVSEDRIKVLEDLAQNPHKINDFIRKHFVESENKLEIFFTPDESLIEKGEKEEIETIKNYEKSLTEKEIQKLDNQIKDFNNWSKEPVPQEVIDTIPKVKLEDLTDSKIFTVEREEIVEDNVTFIDNSINTYDINLVSLKFDTSSFTQEDKLNSELFSILITTSKTKDFSYEEINTNLTKYFFKLSLNNGSNIIDKDTVSRRFSINFEYLQDDSKEVYKTLENILLESEFDNKLEIKKRLEAFRDSILTSSSDANVINKVSTIKAMAQTNPNYNYSLDESIAFGGRSYYVYPLMLTKINNILENFQENFDKLIQDMKDIQNKLFNKDNLLILFANKGNFYNFKRDITPLLDRCTNEKREVFDYVEKEQGKLAVEVPAQNGSSTWGNNLESLGFQLSGKHKVMSNMINEYLNNKIRVQNGAYGAWFYITLSNDMIASSYRDGEVDKTLSTYENIPKFLETVKDIEEDKFKGFILKSMAKYYQAYTPDTLMGISYTHYLFNLKKEDLESEKTEVLSTTKDDLNDFIKLMTEFTNNKHFCTVNNENIIKEKGSAFKFDKIIKFEEIK